MRRYNDDSVLQFDLQNVRPADEKQRRPQVPVYERMASGRHETAVVVAAVARSQAAPRASRHAARSCAAALTGKAIPAQGTSEPVGFVTMCTACVPLSE